MKSTTKVLILSLLSASSALTNAEVSCPNDIVTREHCVTWCSSRPGATSRGWSQSIEGGIGNISKCVCIVGGQNSAASQTDYSCSRTPTPKPLMQPNRSGETCARQGIVDQNTCFAFCQGYNRSPKYIGSGNGIVKCSCLDGPGGSIDYSCSANPSPPTPSFNICLQPKDFECYKSGRPQCCGENDGKDCPDEMTICDNFPENTSGTTYCTWGPESDCYEDGWPSCCFENELNCPRERPGCEKPKPELASQRRFLRNVN